LAGLWPCAQTQKPVESQDEKLKQETCAPIAHIDQQSTGVSVTNGKRHHQSRTARRHDRPGVDGCLSTVACHREQNGVFGGIASTITIMVSPQPQLTSTSTGKASIPLTAADKTRASMAGLWGNMGARAMRFLAAMANRAYFTFLGFLS
jgi:hypothetical protein